MTRGNISSQLMLEFKAGFMILAIFKIVGQQESKE